MTVNTSPRALFVAIALVGAVALSACGSDGSDAGSGAGSDTTDAPDSTGGDDTSGAPTAEDLTGRSFESSEVSGYELVDGTSIVLSFDDGNIAANAGCNGMSGGFSIEDGNLVTGELAQTMMACDQPLMDQDTWVAEFLAASPAVALDGETLTLTGSDATITLAEIADAEIEGTTWTVVGVIDGDAVSSVPADAATITITDGALALNSGCNTGGGDVTVGESTLTFGPVILTRMACTDDALTQLEAAVTTVLDGEVSYEIDGATLILTNGSGAGLQLTAS